MPPPKVKASTRAALKSIRTKQAKAKVAPLPPRARAAADALPYVLPKTPSPPFRPTPPPLPRATPPSPDRIRRWRTPAVWGLGLTACAIGGYATYTYVTLTRGPSDADAPLPVDFDPVARYDATADAFDASMKWVERIQGIGTLRRRLALQARGHVLETAAGTGRNGGYYPTGAEVASLTFVEPSGPMLAVARRKWEEARRFESEESSVPVRWVQASVTGAVPAPEGQPEGYDVVLQTNGLCSTPDPVGMLKSLGQLARPEGRILMLDHGRGYYGFLNKILDQSAVGHAREHGCWWNRDIEEIVKESGLEVVQMKRSGFGTIYEYELKPLSAEERKKLAAVDVKIESPTTQPSKSRFSWLWGG